METLKTLSYDTKTGLRSMRKHLAELRKGEIKSFGFGVRIEKNPFSEDLAWAVCDCGHETPFNAEFFKAIIGRGGNTPPLG